MPFGPPRKPRPPIPQPSLEEAEFFLWLASQRWRPPRYDRSRFPYAPGPARRYPWSPGGTNPWGPEEAEAQTQAPEPQQPPAPAANPPAPPAAAPEPPWRRPHPGYRGILAPREPRGLLDLDISELFPTSITDGLAQWAAAMAPAAPAPAQAPERTPGHSAPLAAPPPPPQATKAGVQLGRDSNAETSNLTSSRRNLLGNVPSAPSGHSQSFTETFQNPPPLFDESMIEALDPNRDRPLFKPPHRSNRQPSEFRRPSLLFPDMLRLASPQNPEGTDPRGLELRSSGDRIFSTVWPYLKQREGGYSDDKSDRGGETKHGISRKFVEAHQLKVGDIRTLLEEQAYNIIREKIYYGHNIDLLPPELQPQVLDASLPAEYGGIKVLQKTLNDMGVRDADGNRLVVDGGIGRRTLEAVDTLSSSRLKELRNRYAETLAKRYRRLARDPTQAKYLRGWLARTEFFRTFKLTK